MDNPPCKKERFEMAPDVAVDERMSFSSVGRRFHARDAATENARHQFAVRFLIIIIIIIIIISTIMFMVLSSWQSHCESSPGSNECRMAPSGRRPKTKPDDLGCESACPGCQNLHPPSPFIIITQPES